MTRFRRTISIVALAWLITLGAGDAAAQQADVAEHFSKSHEAEDNGELSRALNEMLSILRVYPDDYVATLRVGWLRYRLGQFGDSERAYRRAIELEHSSSEARLGLMLPLMEQLRWVEVEQISRALLRMTPGDGTTLMRLAWSQYNQGDFLAASRTYERLRNLVPSDTEVLLGLAWSQIRQSNHEEACPHFERVLELRPGSVRASAGLDLCEG
jgi:tetratricopeptide (TPR) repeat protein